MSASAVRFEREWQEGGRTIGEAIARHARGAADAAALVGCHDEPVTFGQLLSSISSCAAELAGAGLRREDRVGLLVPPGVPGGHLIVALASNVCLVPVNPSLTPHEIVEVARVSGLKALVIPKWLDTAVRLPPEKELALFEAVAARGGALRLELITPAPGKPTDLRVASETDTAVLLRSSGTTGAPKLIPVTHRNLVAMAQKMGSAYWYGLGVQDRAACTSPMYYAAGLKTSLLVPLILGSSVAFPPNGRTFEVAEWLDILKPTYLSVAPGPLNGIVDRLKGSRHAFDGSSLRFLMCSSAYLPEELRLAAQSLLRAPVLEFYGLSEAGIVAANPARPGANRPGTVGLPVPGELLVVDEHCEPVATGAVGHIIVGGPGVTPGYLRSDASGPEELKDGWLFTGDLGRIDEDGYLTIAGRLKEVINRGGEKIFPYEVEKAILQHPAVLEAAAFGVPHPRLGEIVAAAAVLKPGTSASEEQLRAFLGERLAGFKLPRRLQVVTSLPRGNTGKVLRSELSQAYVSTRPETAQPQEWLEFELRDIWERLLGPVDIGIDDDFFEKGGDSLLATEMLMEVEFLVGKPYPASELATLTIRHISEVATAGLAAERDLVTQVKSGTGIPLFFCHGDYVARGLYAHKLAALLPQDQPVFLLHCDPDTLNGSSMEEIAGAYLPEVLRLARGSPVFVGGYCNGGLAAWHLAHLLRSRGVEVVEVLLVETMSLNARPGLRALSRLIATAGSVVPGRAGRLLKTQGMRAVWKLARTGVTGFTAALYRAVRGKLSSGAPEEAHSGQPPRETHLAFPMYYRLMAQYVPPRIDTDVTCLIAEAGTSFDTDTRHWRRLAAGVREVTTPGTHHTMLMSERQALASALAQALQQARTRYLARVDRGKKGDAAADDLVLTE